MNTMFIKSSSLLSLFLFLYFLCLFPVSLYFIYFNKCMMMEWSIISIGATNITFPIVLDSISLSCSALVCLISACVLLFSSSYMDNEVFLGRFIWLIMLFVLSMNLLVFIPNMVSLLIGWDGLGIISFVLVVYYENQKSLAAGMLTVLTNRIGDVMLILAITVMVNQGMWSITYMYMNSYSGLVALLVTIAAMTKSAQIPFSSWLPAAMAAPTPVSALVHSSTLVTAGVLLLIRFFPLLSEFNLFFVCTMLFSTMTLLMAGIGANYEFDLKKIIALSTLSQLGVMMMSLALKMPMLALFHLYTHAVFKALLFLCAGAIIYKNNHSQDVRTMGNIWRQMPVSSSCLNTANLALCGAPFMAGFYSKDLILEMFISSNSSFFMLLCVFFATGLTVTYSIRLSIYVLWSQNSSNSYMNMRDEDWRMTTSMLILAFIAISGGFFMQKLFPMFNENLFMPVEMKLLTSITIMLGVWWALVLWNSGYMYKYCSSMNKNFMSNMWFLIPLSTQPLILPLMSISAGFVKYVDQGWLEIYGGKGIFLSSGYMMKINEFYQNNFISSYIMMIIMSIGILFVIAFTM
nr:NADH dehydrogenase subunit 5 [Acharax sp. NY-2022]